MNHHIVTCADAVSDDRGVFHARVMGREAVDHRWEAWLEFVSISEPGSAKYVTPTETHQQDRAAVELWASGITRVYVEGALARAVRVHAGDDESTASGLMTALQEIIAALDRRIPDVSRAGEAAIAADAARLRLRALRRLRGLTEKGRGVPNGDVDRAERPTADTT